MIKFDPLRGRTKEDLAREFIACEKVVQRLYKDTYECIQNNDLPLLKRVRLEQAYYRNRASEIKRHLNFNHG